MWRANGNPNPCTDLDEILHTHPHLSPRKVLVQVWPPPLTPWACGGLNPISWRAHFLNCSAGCKLTQAATGTSASVLIKTSLHIWRLYVQNFSSLALKLRSKWDEKLKWLQSGAKNWIWSGLEPPLPPISQPSDNIFLVTFKVSIWSLCNKKRGLCGS